MIFWYLLSISPLGNWNVSVLKPSSPSSVFPCRGSPSSHMVGIGGKPFFPQWGNCNMVVFGRKTLNHETCTYDVCIRIHTHIRLITYINACHLKSDFLQLPTLSILQVSVKRNSCSPNCVSHIGSSKVPAFLTTWKLSTGSDCSCGKKKTS